MLTRIAAICYVAIQPMLGRSNKRAVLRIVAAVNVATIISTNVARASRPHPLNEDGAIALLERTLKHDSVYAKRISLGCVSYDTEEKSGAYFQFALREVHNAKCGGDPDTSPVVDRYRVYRRSGKIQRWQATDDSWQPYKPAKIK
jgi:hypothetical protein